MSWHFIQIPDNTFISKTLFTKNATRLTLNDAKEITISNADTFNLLGYSNRKLGKNKEAFKYYDMALVDFLIGSFLCLLTNFLRYFLKIGKDRSRITRQWVININKSLRRMWEETMNNMRRRSSIFGDDDSLRAFNVIPLQKCDNLKCPETGIESNRQIYLQSIY